MTTETTNARDPRLPSVGSKLKREYKGTTHEITCLTHSFKYNDEEYKSLSALARHITGAASINGFLWFGLVDKKAGAGKKSDPRSEPSSAKSGSPEPKKSKRSSAKTSAAKKPGRKAKEKAAAA